MGCIFCDIISKKIPARIIYEDEFAVAFEDVNPQAPVHVLVVPRKHIATSLDITEEDEALMSHLFRVANKVSKDKDIAKRGFRLVTNCNREAGQTIFHLHLHVLGGRIMHWPPG
jgi:histidine triad (HIT) family protein